MYVCIYNVYNAIKYYTTLEVSFKKNSFGKKNNYQ